MALLIFLACARPRGFHSRDTLLGLFWPEADDSAARNALRQALHYLRRSLGEETLTSRSDRDIGVDPERLWCDAAAFDAAIEAGRYDEALELYRGDFLPGFFVEDAPELERWLDDERASRRRAAVDAAWKLAEQEEKSGHMRAATLFARKAVGFTPVDDSAVRRLISLLDRAGEPAAAIEAFEEFERRLSQEYGIPPAAETMAKIQAIKQRTQAAAIVSEPVRPTPAAPTTQPVIAAVPAAALRAAPAARPERTLAAIPQPRRSWGLRLAVAGIAVVLLVTSAWFATSRRTADPVVESARALAVLPFANLSADADNEYFSDGITDEILSALMNVEGLRVASRTSSFAFKNAKDDIREIGAKLGVSAVLEGTVRRDGNRVKITAQLVNVADGMHLWSKSYDREIKDIFAVQEEIAHSITEALALQFSAADHEAHMRRATRDPEAYDLYLRGKYLVTIRSQEQNQEAIRLFAEASERDPKFALAFAGMAQAQIAAAEFVAPRQVLPRAKAAALRALQLDSTLFETRLALSEVRQVYDRDWLAAEHEIQRAIALHPNSSEAHTAYANLMLDAGRFEEAKREREQAWHLRALQAPDSMLTSLRVERELSWATYYWYVSDLAEAMKRAKAAVALDPTHSVARLVVSMLYVDMNRPEDAVREAEIAVHLSQRATGFLPHLGRAYAAAGRIEEARALLDTLHERARTRYVGKDQIALLHYALGDTSATLDWLEAAVDDYHWWMPNSNFHPLWKGLHHHPRFVAMMKKIGAR